MMERSFKSLDSIKCRKIQADTFYLRRTPLVYVGLFLTMIKTLCGRSNYIPYPDQMDNLVSACILFTFIFAIFLKKYSIKNLFLYGIVGLLALYTAKITGIMLLPVTVLIILAIRNEPMDFVAKFMYFWKIRFFIIHSIFAFLLAPTGLSRIGGIYERNRRYRMNFGFNYAGQFTDYVMDLMILWIICNYDKLNKTSFIKLFIVAIFTYLCSDSKTGLGVSCILIVLVWLSKRTTKMDRIIRNFDQFSIPVLTGLLFYTINSFALGKSWAYYIDDLLTTRIRLNGYLYSIYGTTWFGQVIESYSGEYSEIWQSIGSTFDCVYSWLIIEVGAVWLILIALSFYILAKRRDRLLNCFLAVWILGALTDTDYLYGTCNCTILMLSLVFSTGKTIYEDRNPLISSVIR